MLILPLLLLIKKAKQSDSILTCLIYRTLADFPLPSHQYSVPEMVISIQI